MDTLILVNDRDEKIGLSDKITAHKHGLLHRAFSIVILKQEHQQTYALLQQRAKSKYHCGGLWSNTCCSHFIANMPDNERLHSRLGYEMGLQANLQHCGTFKYKACVGKLIEHEMDHVYFGWDTGITPTINATEVMAYSWQRLDTLLASNSENYTPWLPRVLQIVYEYLIQGENNA